MKRPVISYSFQEKIPLPYPDYETWSVQQKKVHYLINHMKGHETLTFMTINHFAFNYGDFNDVDKFVEFFINFWNAVGQYMEFDLDLVDLVDEIFIDWIKIMKYERFCDEMSMCHSTYKKFVFQPE